VLGQGLRRQLHGQVDRRFDNVLDVDVACLSVGRSSFALRFVIERSADVIASVDIVYVNVDTSAAASRPLTDGVAAALKAAIGT
jgi:acyl-CoA thioester hydrolase